MLEDADNPNSSHDFGGDIIPNIVKNGKAMAHRFDDSCVRHASATESYWRGRPVAIVAAAGLSGWYRRALGARGVEVVVTDAERLTRAGLARARRQQEETPE